MKITHVEEKKTTALVYAIQNSVRPAFQNRIKIQLVLLKTFSTNAFNDINDEGTYLKPDTTQHNAGLSQFKELPLLSLTAHI